MIGTKQERIACVYLDFRGYILSGSNDADIFTQCRGGNGHAEGRSRGKLLFKGFKRWLEVTSGTPHSVKDVPTDAVLMKNFPQAEIDHFMVNEEHFQTKRQIVHEGED